MRDGWMGNRYTALTAPRIAAMILAAIYCLVGFNPYNWQMLPKHKYDNGAEVVEGSGVQFKSRGIARTDNVPEWLEPVISTSTLRVLLDVQTDKRKQYGPARIFTVSVNPYRRNLTIGQTGDDLVVRLRTPTSDLNGQPENIVDNVFNDEQWHRVEVSIDPVNLVIRVDDVTVKTLELPADPLSNWDPNYKLALGSELLDDRHWIGKIRTAVVEADGRRVDYLSPGVLHIPSKIILSKTEYANRLPRYQIIPFSMKYQKSYWRKLHDWIPNLIGFIPFGFFLMRAFDPQRSIIFIVSSCALVSVTIEAGQILLPSRYTSADDLVLNTVGGTIGAFLGRIRQQTV